MTLTQDRSVEACIWRWTERRGCVAGTPQPLLGAKH